MEGCSMNKFMNPQISVIVPVYNVQKYLKRCVDSILAQTFENFELLLVDDGSKDDSYSTCMMLSGVDDRIKVWHQENKGVSAARTLGFMKSEGEYVFFIDADDTLNPDALETLHAKIIQGYDMVSCNTPFDCEMTGSEYVHGILELKIPVNIWGKLIRRNLLDENVMLLPPSIAYGEDLALNLKLGFIMHKICLMSEQCYNYIYNPDSVTSKKVISYDYELDFHKLISEILGNKMDIYRDSYRYLSLSTLDGLIRSGADFDYNASWIKDLFNNKSQLTLSKWHWIILHVKNPFICRCILKICNKFW